MVWNSMNGKRKRCRHLVKAMTDTVLIETTDGFVELATANRFHKRLGKAWSGNLRQRGQAALDHRVSCAWMKFRSLQNSLLDKHMNIQQHLMLSNASVKPTLVYGLETCALTGTLGCDPDKNASLHGWLGA